MIQNTFTDFTAHFPGESTTVKRFTTNYIMVLLVVDALLVQLTLWFSMQMRFILPLGAMLEPQFVQQKLDIPLPGLHILVGLLWLASFFIASIYAAPTIIRWSDEFQRILFTHTIAALCMAGMLYLTHIELMRLVYAYFYLFGLVTLLGYRTALRLWHRRQGHSIYERNVLVIGAGETSQHLIQQLQSQDWPGYHLVGLVNQGQPLERAKFAGVPILGSIDQADLAALVRKHEVADVVITLPREMHEQRAYVMELLQDLPVNMRVVPDYFDSNFRRTGMSHLGYIPLIDLYESPLDSFQRAVKRLCDLAVTIPLTLLFSPVLALVALAIKWEDGGPILYNANRVGENGRIFTMHKFRSMVFNADRLQAQVNQVDAQGNLIHKTANDPRVTRVGRLIRRTSLDELPQLFNILKGDMSLIGPRPELPWLVEKYEKWQYKRLTVPQGLTGWWQVNGRSANAMHLSTQQDLYYIQNYSLWLDVQILWRTIGAVFGGKGAF